MASSIGPIDPTKRTGNDTKRQEQQGVKKFAHNTVEPVARSHLPRGLSGKSSLQSAHKVDINPHDSTTEKMRKATGKGG